MCGPHHTILEQKKDLSSALTSRAGPNSPPPFLNGRLSILLIQLGQNSLKKKIRSWNGHLAPSGDQENKRVYTSYMVQLVNVKLLFPVSNKFLVDLAFNFKVMLIVRLGLVRPIIM